MKSKNKQWIFFLIFIIWICIILISILKFIETKEYAIERYSENIIKISIQKNYSKISNLVLTLTLNNVIINSQSKVSEQSTDLMQQEIENNKKYFELSNYERYVVECIVTGESGNQPYEGKVAVANCILNACIKDELQPSQVRKQYKYSGWKDINEWNNLYPESAQEVKKAVNQVFNEGNLLNSEMLWFYNPKYASGGFHSSQKFIFQIGDHYFYAPWEE